MKADEENQAPSRDISWTQCASIKCNCHSVGRVSFNSRKKKKKQKKRENLCEHWAPSFLQAINKLEKEKITKKSLCVRLFICYSRVLFCSPVLILAYGFFCSPIIFISRVDLISAKFKNHCRSHFRLSHTVSQAKKKKKKRVLRSVCKSEFQVYLNLK